MRQVLYHSLELCVSFSGNIYIIIIMEKPLRNLDVIVCRNKPNCMIQQYRHPNL